MIYPTYWFDRIVKLLPDGQIAPRCNVQSLESWCPPVFAFPFIKLTWWRVRTWLQVPTTCPSLQPRWREFSFLSFRVLNSGWNDQSKSFCNSYSLFLFLISKHWNALWSSILAKMSKIIWFQVMFSMITSYGRHNFLTITICVSGIFTQKYLKSKLSDCVKRGYLNLLPKLSFPKMLMRDG